MRIEVDVSSRLEHSGDTTFGFANDTQRAVRLKQRDRDECFQALTGDRLSRRLRIFAACLYLLLEDHLPQITHVTIDDEYVGHGRDVKRHLVNIIRQRLDPTFNEAVIEVKRIGEKSPAHEVAWLTLRGKRKADQVLRSAEILRLLQS